jgi:uncharacterized protein with NRDE domain
MCLIVVGWQVHPDFPLVVAANRDEFYARPTASAGRWPDHRHVIGGRDLQAGGTWLGVDRLPRAWLLRTLGAVLIVAGAKLLFT